MTDDPGRAYAESVAKAINDTAAEQEAYLKRVHNARDFAKDVKGTDAWAATYLLGIALSGLELVPVSLHFTRKVYWVRAPSGTWEPSHLVPIEDVRGLLNGHA